MTVRNSYMSAGVMWLPPYANRVFYVKGRATSFRALKRARVDMATCVYILARKHSHGSGIEEDAETVLIALALSAFGISDNRVRKSNGRLVTNERKFQVYAQTVLPGTISHLTYLQTTRVVCVDEMRMGIMAQNCAAPGFATLAFMLSTSVADHRDWDFSGVFAESIAQSTDDSWIKNYLHGISQEIYQTRVPNSLVGKSFFKATRYFYRCHGLLIFSVGSFCNTRSPISRPGHHPSIDSDTGYYQIILAPRNYVLQKYDMLFAISTDVQSVLNAMMYAERVSIKSTKIERSVWKRTMPVEARIDETETPPPSPQHSPRRNFIGMLSNSQQEKDSADAGAGASMGGRFLLAALEDGAPNQIDSPRRMVTRSPASRRQRTSGNYISDSDSSYFSPSRNNIDTTVRGQTTNDTPDKAAEAVRIEKYTAVRRENFIPQGLSNHIVVCDASESFPRNIELLIRALKQAYQDHDLTIVILSQGDPGMAYRLVLQDLPNVYHIRGTPLAQADLRRTQIERAQKAIVLGNCNARTYPDSNGESSTDSAAILTNMNIQAICGGQFFVTTELLDIENIRYLDHTQLLGEPLLKRTFMGGHIFMPAMLDTALCQCYFSSHILDVLSHLTFSHATDTMEANIISAYRPGRLSLLYVPDRFIGKRYDTLCLTLMKQHSAVPLGLYRYVTHDAQNFAAVMCNPQPSTPLLSADAVYVLGPNIPGWNHFADSLRSLRIASQPPFQPGEADSPNSAATSKDGGQSSGSGQSRHTVYSHNTQPGTSSMQSSVDAKSDPAVLFAQAAGEDADADESDIEAGDHVSIIAAATPATRENGADR
ncbi:hypothetical protein GGI07_002814 [Coemansia sp. Benny D115]|nr:hypothetical protein GGI07_002814 [Coemansia sp. Benny D115]